MVHLKLQSVHRIVIFALAGVIALSACYLTATHAGQEPEDRPAVLKGYLPLSALPDSKALLPPPPAEGSAAMRFDAAVSQKSLNLHGTSRWDMAARDAILKFPEAVEPFACAIEAPISKQATPRLYNLLRRCRADAGMATFAAKNHYKRPRPFLVNRQPICTPKDENRLKHNGSYPSGHTAIGWTWALILAEIAPDRADAVIARGRAFGESRIVCNVHWYSDVLEGRLVGSATVAALHADAAFRADLDAARAELAATRARGLKPAHDCQADFEIMNKTIW